MFSKLFDEYLPIICESIEKQNFQSCATISTDLIKLSEMVDYHDGVIIGEVLETVFNQVFTEMTRFEISPEERENLKRLFIGDIQSIYKCYKEEDKNDLFNALKNMRFNATRFQFRSRRQCKQITQQMPFPMPIFR